MKLPPGELPVLSDKELRQAEHQHAIGVSTRVENQSRRGLIAKAQRDADMRWLKGQGGPDD